LNASEKGFERLMEGLSILDKISPSNESSFSVEVWKQSAESALLDDFNAPILIANLFEAVKQIHALNEGKAQLNETDLSLFKATLAQLTFEVLGIEPIENQGNDRLDGVMQVVIALRQKAREQKDWASSDMIRDGLAKAGIQIKDGKEGTTWG
jgi:cysteinyl-tRNA synthetase